MMRSRIRRALGLGVGMLLLAGFFAAPVASAQTDDAEECTETVTTTAVEDVIEIQTFLVDVLPEDEYDVFTQVEELRGIPTSTLVTRSEQRPVPCDPDEVLGEVVLAVTGSTVSTPVAIGVSLIGAGGLLVAATRKRRNAD